MWVVWQAARSGFASAVERCDASSVWVLETSDNSVDTSPKNIKLEIMMIGVWRDQVCSVSASVFQKQPQSLAPQRVQ